jgi:hypothetical protein
MTAAALAALRREAKRRRLRRLVTDRLDYADVQAADTEEGRAFIFSFATLQDIGADGLEAYIAALRHAHACFYK